MNTYSIKILIMGALLIYPQQVVRTGGDEDASWDVASLVVGGVAGAVCGWVGTHFYHTSSYKKSVEAQKERSAIQDAEAALARIANRAHYVLHVEIPSYAGVVGAFHQSGGATGAVLSDQIHDFLVIIREQREHMQEITGKFSSDGAELRSKAESVLTKLLMWEQRCMACEHIMEQIRTLREEPLRKMNEIEGLVERIAAHAVSVEQLLYFIRKEYGAVATADGLKGMPLMCGAERLTLLRKEVRSARSQLEQHLVLVADAEICSLVQGCPHLEQDIVRLHHIITGTPEFAAEVALHSVRKETLLQAQTEYAYALAEKTNAEAAKVREERARLEQENRKKELELQSRQVAQAASLAAAATAITLTALTHQMCPEHDRDYYHCPCTCRYRREYCRVYVIS